MSVNLGPSVLLPAPGLAQHARPPSALYLKLTPDMVAAIAAANGHNMRLSLGPSGIQLKVGSRTFDGTTGSESMHTDLYRHSSKDSYSHVGRVTHRLTISRNATDMAAASTLKTQSDQLLKEKQSHRATLLAADEPTNLKRSLAGHPRKSSPAAGLSSPALHAADPSSVRSLPGSPLSSATSPPSSTSKHSTLATMTTAKKPLSAMSLSSGPIRVLHLLSLGPTTAQTIASRTNLPLKEVEGILKEYARALPNSSSFVIADSRYKDLRVWDWKPYSPNERKKIIEESEAAFDRLAYPAEHPARRNLIEPKLRKKLTTDRPVTPLSDRPQSPAQLPVPVSSSAAVAKRAVGAILSNNKAKRAKAQAHPSPSPAAGTTPRPTSSPSPPRSNGSKKVKSAEYVQDSDEEASYALTATNTRIASPRISTPVSASALTPQPAKSPVPKSSASSGAQAKRKAAASGISTGTVADSPSAAKSLKVSRTSTPTSKLSQQPTSAATADEDLFDLARKFRDTYSEYAKLYSLVSGGPGKRPKAEVQRLLTMHRNLESWKEKLWASSPKAKKGTTT